MYVYLYGYLCFSVDCPAPCRQSAQQPWRWALAAQGRASPPYTCCNKAHSPLSALTSLTRSHSAGEMRGGHGPRARVRGHAQKRCARTPGSPRGRGGGEPRVRGAPCAGARTRVCGVRRWCAPVKRSLVRSCKCGARCACAGAGAYQVGCSVLLAAGREALCACAGAGVCNVR